jgi:hypothetical protein
VNTVRPTLNPGTRTSNRPTLAGGDTSCLRRPGGGFRSQRGEALSPVLSLPTRPTGMNTATAPLNMLADLLLINLPRFQNIGELSRVSEPITSAGILLD